MHQMIGAEDRLAIHELAARYGNVIDARDWDGLAHEFTEHASFETHGFGTDAVRTDGLQAIRPCSSGVGTPLE